MANHSFRYPPNLLHSLVEPQWLPRPRDEIESSLGTLEYYEEQYLENLRSIVLPKPCEPIGIAGANDEIKIQYTSNITTIGGGDTTDTNVADLSILIPPPPIQSFWEKYKKVKSNDTGSSNNNKTGTHDKDNGSNKDLNNIISSISSNDSYINSNNIDSSIEKKKMISQLIRTNKLSKYHLDKTPTTSFRMNRVQAMNVNRTNGSIDSNNTLLFGNDDDNNNIDISNDNMEQCDIDDNDESLPLYHQNQQQQQQQQQRRYTSYSPITSTQPRRRRRSLSGDSNDYNDDEVAFSLSATTSMSNSIIMDEQSSMVNARTPTTTDSNFNIYNSSTSLHSSGWRNFLDPVTTTTTTTPRLSVNTTRTDNSSSRNNNNYAAASTPSFSHPNNTTTASASSANNASSMSFGLDSPDSQN